MAEAAKLNAMITELINSVSESSISNFIRQQNRSFVPVHEDLSHLLSDNKSFCQLSKLGEITYPDTDRLLVFSCLYDGELSARSARKMQFEIAKKALTADFKDGAIFVFYDARGTFRFSFIRRNYGHKEQKFSPWKRYTYFVEPDNEKNRTFRERMLACKFESLDAIQQAFSVEQLTKDFYKELSNWYFWAIKTASYPNDVNDDTDDVKFNNENIIRLITRLIFVWFLRQKDLVKPQLFDVNALSEILNGFEPQSQTQNNYYRAILQNLFFATLNQEIDKRGFAEDKNFNQNKATYNIKNLYRYENEFQHDTGQIMELFNQVPFLNGGLFECLDNKQKDGKIYDWDGFSRNPHLQAKLPNILFFGSEAKVDLSGEYNDKKMKAVRVTGIIEILKRYNFTVEENTPVEVEVALDPELLGKVFENLLGAFNPETQETARKQTGSFYTPREIVNYMVDESLIAYLSTCLSSTPAGSDICSQDTISENTTPTGSNTTTTNNDSINIAPRCGEEKLRELLGYETDTNPFTPTETELIIKSIFNCKILDPATGSGAFPMGFLQQMVHILRKLDPNNTHWNNVVMAQAMSDLQAAEEISNDEKQNLLAEIEHSFDDSVNYPDYARKLYLIENCIYGVDIQSIAVQISKLRFFISLVCEQNHSNDASDNFGIRPLPNLETKFVAANTLIGIETSEEDRTLFKQDKIQKLIDKLKQVRHRQFLVTNAQQKKKLRDEDEKLRHDIVTEVQTLYVKRADDDIFRLKMQLKQSEKELENLNKETDNIQTTAEQLDIFGGSKTKTINLTENKRTELKIRINRLNTQITDSSKYAKLESVVQLAEQLTSWNPYDQNASSPFFDPEWMFGIKDGFDIVGGNPPYINIKNQNEQTRSILSKYKYSKGADIYVGFMEKGYELLKHSSTLCYIIPNKFFGAGYGKNIREYIQNHKSVKSIWDLKDEIVFESASITTIVFLSLNENQNERNTLIKFNNINRYVDSIFDDNGKIQLESSDIEKVFLNAVISKTRPLFEIADIRTGVMGFEYWKMLDIIQSNGKIDNYNVPIYTNGNLQRYIDNWECSEITLYKSKYQSPTIQLNNEYLNNNTIELFKTKPKIIVRGVSKEVAGIIDERGSGLLVAVHSICPKLIEINTLLGIINSKFVNWFHLKTFYSQRIPQGSLKYPIEFFNSIPIPIIENTVNFKIRDLVNILSNLNNKISEIDKNEINNQIDNLVYRLYNLTYEEVKVIEPDIESKISEEEYNAIEI
jgi:hypothetical protein